MSTLRLDYFECRLTDYLHQFDISLLHSVIFVLFTVHLGIIIRLDNEKLTISDCDFRYLDEVDALHDVNSLKSIMMSIDGCYVSLSLF